MAEDKLVVSLQAETAKMKAGLAEGKREVGKFGDGVKQTIGKIGIAMAGAFAATKIISFVKTGITEFAKFDRSLTLITGKIERMGKGFDGLRGQVESYLRGAEEASRFNKFELGRSLDDLITKTGDFNTAIALNEMAMDLAVAGNVGLKVASDALALAHEGNTSGLSQLARIMGMSTEAAKDLNAVFAEIEITTRGMARAEVGLATDLDKMSNSMNDASEVVGERMGPGLTRLGTVVLKAFTASVQFTMNVLDTWGVRFGALAVTAMNAFEFITESAAALAQFFKDVWKGPGEAFDAMTESMGESWDTFKQSQVDLTTLLIEEEQAIWQQGAENKNTIDLQAAANSLRTKKKEVKDTKTAEKAKLTFSQKMLAGLVAADAKKRKLDAAEIAKFEATKLQVIQGGALGAATALQGFVASQVAGTATAREAWNELGKGIFGAMVQALGGALIAEGTVKLAEGAAALLGIATIASAPGLLAGGALLIAAGAGIQALTLLLAEGGIVTGPTLAMIGEGEGPEAVIPLERAGEFGFGGMAGPITVIVESMEFPGITAVGDLEDAEFSETAGRRLAEGLQDVFNRKGARLAGV